MSKAIEYHEKNIRLFNSFLCIGSNHETIEDVKALIGRLKESGYDDAPENWYVDGEELLTELKKLKV